ncbi:Na(+)/H(+) exchange regulatory cofactor NHE-RF1-like isoform X2 [Xyrauchen texanus]|uniref:Na(+)/H(+) exchange regulatory cofactor NHE-RF1-like isoform X2 n=1 Tax=Xyrauchen texanus TaxID=154827 RepID=UPI002242802C|nr:Na(+)/H(+) exchange regulatory cofactor NHE-RF1-like isoform X2 [Xyrauchen texanus]
MPSQTLRPRLCVLEKDENGYGFHLHGEKGKIGQFIRLVEPGSPAELSGLRAGDRLVFVNGERVENESHQQVVLRIRATAGNLELIVVDVETDQLLKKHELMCVKEFVTVGIPVPECNEPEFSGDLMGNDTPRESPSPSPPVPVPKRNGDIIPVHIPAVEELRSSVSSDMDFKLELRPRLCVIRKGPNGFGFNLHSEKSRPGQYIRAIDDDSPAERSGLQPKDHIIQVNGVPVEGKQHSEVVAAIKASGEETTLLVVDPDTDAFFRKCQVMPTAEHITGPLPEPLLNGDMEDKVVEPSIVDAIPELNLSLQQVKERTHQKRSNKRAPPMDWSKKYELFSNL